MAPMDVSFDSFTRMCAQKMGIDEPVDVVLYVDGNPIVTAMNELRDGDRVAVRKRKRSGDAAEMSKRTRPADVIEIDDDEDTQVKKEKPEEPKEEPIATEKTVASHKAVHQSQQPPQMDEQPREIDVTEVVDNNGVRTFTCPECPIGAPNKSWTTTAKNATYQKKQHVNKHHPDCTIMDGRSRRALSKSKGTGPTRMGSTSPIEASKQAASCAIEELD